METNSTFSFQDYIGKLFPPSCMVHSTEEAKKILEKNFLKPSEFLRPFGNFIGQNINFSFAEKFSINIKNFKLDFFDVENFKSYDSNNFNESLELLIANNTPDWDYKNVKI
jgi:hypothetical protein